MHEFIVDSSPFGVCIVDEAGIVVFRNRSAERMLQFGDDDSGGVPISDILPALSMQEGKLTIQSLGIGELANVVSLPSAHPEPRFCDISLSQFTDKSGRSLTIVSLNDVTRHIRSWQALKDQEERWNLALQGSQIGVFESDLRTGSGTASDTWYQLLGIRRVDGRDSDLEWRERIHPEDRAEVEALDAECIEGRVETSEAKFRMRVGGGDWRWMRSMLRVTERDREGNALRLLGTMIDITPLESALELAEARKQGLHNLMANAPLAMAVLSLDGTFLLVNDACYALFGYPQGALEQKQFWKLSNIRALKNVKAEVERILAGSATVSLIEEHYVRPDGERIDIVIHISILPFEDAANTRIILQLVDITEKKRLEALKDDFVATVSHELRTPLASIHGALRLLDSAVGAEASEQVTKLLGMAQRNSVRLTEVVNDLLDFQKLTTGHFVVKMTKVDVVSTVEEIVLDSEPFARQFDISVAVEAPDKAVFVSADEQRLKQVIINLLSNAAKFSDRGATVSVDVTVDRRACMISVSNYGRGISPEFGERLFQPFSQQAEHLSRNRGGTGLGLAISKELVENMGGEIGYSSTPNTRTTFWVRFPLYEESTQSPEALAN